MTTQLREATQTHNDTGWDEMDWNEMSRDEMVWKEAETLLQNNREAEPTAGDVLDALQERLALARTRALMGEREEALGLLRIASLEYARFRDVLKPFPGVLALEHALEQTTKALCEEAMAEDSVPVAAPATEQANKHRRAA